MKKALLFFALAVLCAGAALGQSKPRVAVYVTGNVEQGAKKVVTSKLLLAVTLSEEYFAVERQDKFLAELNKEHTYQNSGAVDEKQIIALGKKWGANYVCVAEISKVYGSTFISARLIRVITGQVTAVADGSQMVLSIADLNEVAEGIAERLFDVNLPKIEASGNNAAGLRIGKVTWATCNVDDYQTFAERPDMYTKFYQWNRSMAWNATAKTVSGWNSNEDRASTWTVNPCPSGWRLPTRTEYQALHNAGTTWASANTRGNAVAGRFYGANHATCSLPNSMTGCVFLPAVGFRYYSDGALSNQGSFGYYWSATEYSGSLGYFLYFVSTNSFPDGLDKAFGFTVRCVR